MTNPGAPKLDSISHARQAVRTDQMLGIEFVLLRKAEAADQPSEVTGSMEPGPSGTDDDPGAMLARLREEHDANCAHCTRSTCHTQTVFGEGDPQAELMFVGEAPGAEEDRTGRPFVGKAGAKLDEMIRAMGFSRDEVYIANVLKCRPPNNRTPLEDEIDACSPYLAAQVRIIRPSAIVTLGGPASKLLLKTEQGITRLRGSWGNYDAGEQQVPVMPTFHPAYILRNPSREVRLQVWEDLQEVVSRLGRELPA